MKSKEKKKWREREYENDVCIVEKIIKKRKGDVD